MTKVKFKLEVDTSDIVQVKALSTLLAAIGGIESFETTQVSVKGSPEITEGEEKPKRKRRTRAEIAADENKEEPAAEVEPKPEKKATGKKEKIALPEFTEVRAIFAKQLQAGDESTREACIGKLKEFGADKLPDLSSEHYVEFMDFLEALDIPA